MKLKIDIKLRRKRDVMFAEDNTRVEVHSRDLEAFWKRARKTSARKIKIEVEPKGILCRCTLANGTGYSRFIKNLI